MQKPTAKQTWLGLAFAVLTFATSYLGLDKYQQDQVTVEASDIEVNITSTQPHTHPPDRSNQDIQAMIDKAVNAKMDKHIEGRIWH